jgi:hypothetical protein
MDVPIDSVSVFILKPVKFPEKGNKARYHAEKQKYDEHPGMRMKPFIQIITDEKPDSDRCRQDQPDAAHGQHFFKLRFIIAVIIFIGHLIPGSLV